MYTKKKLILLLFQFYCVSIISNVLKLKKSSKVAALSSISNNSAFIEALNNKYQCPTEPAQLSTFAQSIQLTGPTTVNSATIRRSNNIGMLVRQYTNQYRARFGLPPLSWDQFLAKVARPHTVAMARGNASFSHAGFQRRFNWYSSKRPTTVRFGENLIYFYNPSLTTNAQLARFAVDSWISSPGHEQNLRGNFNRIGVAAFRNIHNVWYMTQLFALVQ